MNHAIKHQCVEIERFSTMKDTKVDFLHNERQMNAQAPECYIKQQHYVLKCNVLARVFCLLVVHAGVVN